MECFLFLYQKKTDQLETLNSEETYPLRVCCCVQLDIEINVTL